jgi:threonine dehydrogenase-like Zn-dependent dehydrogenase
MPAGIFAIDSVAGRLDKARALGAEAIDFSQEDPVAALLELTQGIGVDRIIDAVGVDATLPEKGGPAAKALEKAGELESLLDEQAQVAPKTNPKGDNWHPGNAPSLVLTWAVKSIAKGGTLSIIGVYPETAKRFPIGAAMNKNLNLRMGNCPHRKYLPLLLELVRNGTIDPQRLLSQQQPLLSALDAYQEFDKRSPGWVKVELQPQTH